MPAQGEKVVANGVFGSFAGSLLTESSLLACGVLKVEVENSSISEAK